MTNEQSIRRLEDLQRLYLGNEKFTADIEAIEIAIEALKRTNTYQKPTGRRERRREEIDKVVKEIRELCRNNNCRNCEAQTNNGCVFMSSYPNEWAYDVTESEDKE